MSEEGLRGLLQDVSEVADRFELGAGDHERRRLHLVVLKEARKFDLIGFFPGYRKILCIGVVLVLGRIDCRVAQFEVLHRCAQVDSRRGQFLLAVKFLRGEVVVPGLQESRINQATGERRSNENE